MRDYSKVSAQFWTGKTGRSLRGDMQTQIVALYLMTSPHSNMIGVFNCPVIYISHETGSPLEGANEGLKKLIEGGFCTYDEDSETVWIHEMAKFQIGDSLKASDNRVKDIQKQYENLPEGPIKQGFYEKYRDAYHLPENGMSDSPSEAPSKPLPSQKQEQKQEQEQEQALEPSDDGNAPPAATPKPKASPTGTRLPEGWMLPKAWGEWALAERNDLTADDVRREAACFADHWHGKAGADARKADWEATWRNWIRRSNAGGQAKGARPAGKTPARENFDNVNYGTGGRL